MSVNIVDLEDAILSAVSSNFTYFKTVEKSDKVSFDENGGIEFSLPAFFLEEKGLQPDSISIDDDTDNVSFEAFVIYPLSQKNTLKTNIRSIGSFFKGKKWVKGVLNTVYLGNEQAEFDVPIRDLYIRSVKFNVTII